MHWLTFKKVKYASILEIISDHVQMRLYIIRSLYHPFSPNGLHNTKLHVYWLVCRSTILLSHNFLCIRICILLQRKSFTGLLILTSSGCRRSVQLGGTITYSILFCPSKPNTSFIICPLNSSRITKAEWESANSSCFRFSWTYATIINRTSKFLQYTSGLQNV